MARRSAPSGRPGAGFGNLGSRKRALESSHPWLGEAIALVRDKYEAQVHRVLAAGKPTPQ